MSRLLPALLLLSAGCTAVNWHDGRGWHRPRTGMELVLTKNFGSGLGYGECKNAYPGVAVFSARWDDSPIREESVLDCLGDVSGAIENARVANGLTHNDLVGVKVLLIDAANFPCGKDFHLSDHCTSPDGAVFASWWTLNYSLAAAFKNLHSWPEQ